MDAIDRNVEAARACVAAAAGKVERATARLEKHGQRPPLLHEKLGLTTEEFDRRIHEDDELRHRLQKSQWPFDWWRARGEQAVETWYAGVEPLREKLYAAEAESAAARAEA